MAKIRLNTDAMKDSFLRNVEKILFGCVVLVFLVFVYGAIGREKFATTPEELARLAQDAEARIASTAPTGIDEELPVRDYLTLATGIRRDIEDKFYELPNIWNRPVFESGEIIFRMPEVYTVRDIRCTPGYGSLGAGGMGMGMEAMAPEMMAPGAGAGAPGKPQGSRWVMLTGLIDVAKQIEAFKEAVPSSPIPGQSPGGGAAGMADAGMAGMAGSMGGPTSAREPDWVWAYVERAEVTGTGQSQLEWTDVGPGQQWLTASRQAMPGDLIEPKYMVSRRVTFPLPNVRNHRWGPEAVHLPEIPIRSKEETPTAAGGPLQPEQERQKQAIEDPFSQRPGMGMPGMDAGMPGMDMGMPGMEMAADPMGMMGADPAGMPGMGGYAVRIQKADVGLFRFFDFTVEPGKHYRYRVKLLLKNPCYQVSLRYLESPELAKEKGIASDWSDPTEVISVPHDSRLLAGEVDPSRNIAVEPSAQLMLIHFDEQTGRESSTEKTDVLRGQLANFKVEVEKKPAMTMAMGGMPGMEGMGMDAAGMGPAEGMGAPPATRRPRERRRPEPEGEKETIEYRTEHVLLDLAGGDRLARDLKSPSRLLLLDPDGKLIVRNELNDADEFKQYVKEEAPKPAAGGMMPGMEGMMPGMEGMMPGMEGMGPAEGMMAPPRRGNRRGR